MEMARSFISFFTSEEWWMSIFYNNLWPRVARFCLAAFSASAWTLSYIVILSIMYLFHSPFRVHSDCRTDWYAQMMKVFQVWCAIVIICFHISPHLLRSYQQTRTAQHHYGNYSSIHINESNLHSALAQVKKEYTNEISDEDALNDVAIVFLPVFWALNITFLYLHKVKRKWQMGVTYGMSYGVVILNSLLLSLFAIMHYSMCALLPLMEISDNSTIVNSMHNASVSSTLVNSTTAYVHFSTSSRKRYMWMPIIILQRLLYSSPAHEHLYTTILRLVCIDLVFIWVDYQYKRFRGFDPARGILWSDVYDVQRPNTKWKPAPLGPFKSAFLGKKSTKLSAYKTNNNRSNKDNDDDPDNVDFRRLEPKPRRITHRELQRHKWYVASTQPESPPLESSETAPLQKQKVKHEQEMNESKSKRPNFAWLDFRPTRSEVEELKRIERPCNRPGMVPWFSTFIMNTTWQTIARGALEFLTFDVRGLLGVTKPKIFHFHFSPNADTLPSPMLPSTDMTNKQNNETVMSDAETSAARFLSPLQIPLHPSSYNKDETELIKGNAKQTLAKDARDNNSGPVPDITSTTIKKAEKATVEISKATDNNAMDVDVWFDWIADIGDGFNSTYELARLLAAPSLCLPLSHSTWSTMSAAPFAKHITTSQPPLQQNQKENKDEQEKEEETSHAHHTVETQCTESFPVLVPSLAHVDVNMESSPLQCTQEIAPTPDDSNVSETSSTCTNISTSTSSAERANVPLEEVAYSEGHVQHRLKESFDLSSHAASVQLPFTTSSTSSPSAVVVGGWEKAEIQEKLHSVKTARSAIASLTRSNTFTHKSNHETGYTLPRGSFVIVGGDLAYPNPTDENYTNRLFGPYSDALRGSHTLRQLFHDQQQSVIIGDAHDDDVAHVYTLDARSVSQLNVQRHHELERKQNTSCTQALSVSEILHSIPMFFAIPGNHDWFDGLSTFRKYMVERSWIGGWLMPQRSSFFVLRLPYNWWILCGDTGHTRDIDVAQRNYFLHVIEKYMDEASCVILSCHEPVWVYDAMLSVTSTIQPELQKVAFALGTRLRVRIAGDIHHYSRHIPLPVHSEAATLIVSGGGGAFLHGARRNLVISQGTEYLRACAFPPRNTYLSIASRLFGFRLINWKFDLIVGVLCFVMIFSMIPQSFLSVARKNGLFNQSSTDVSINSNNTSISSSNSSQKVSEIHNAMDMTIAIVLHTFTLVDYLFSKGIISIMAVFVFFACFATAGVENGAPLWWRTLYSIPWTLSVVIICCSGLSYLICALSYLSNNGMLCSVNGTWGSPMEEQVRLTADVVFNETIRILSQNSHQPQHLLHNVTPISTNNTNLSTEQSFEFMSAVHVAMMATGQLLLRLQHYLYGSKMVEFVGLLLRCLDPLETFAFLSHKVSSETIGTFNSETTRSEMFLYYLHILFFYWILVTPLVSFVIGTFLFVSVTAFDYMYDAAYSAFQIEDYKHFIRFKIDSSTRALHGYVIAERHVPKVWELDKRHVMELSSEEVKHIPPHLQHHPSRWRPPQTHTIHMYNAQTNANDCTQDIPTYHNPYRQPYEQESTNNTDVNILKEHNVHRHVHHHHHQGHRCKSNSFDRDETQAEILETFVCLPHRLPTE